MRVITFAIAVMAVLPASVIFFTDTGIAAGAGTIGLTGDGTDISPYLISSADDLRTVSASHSDHPWAYYRQTSDIVFDNGTVPGGNITINISKENGKVVIGMGTDAPVPKEGHGVRTTYAYVTLNDSQTSSEWNDMFDDVTFDTSVLRKKNTLIVHGKIDDKNFAAAISFSEIGGKMSLTAPFSGNFIPIGSKERPFSGYYDGGGYSITGMKVACSGVGESSAGMFGYTNNAVIFNTHINSTAENASYAISAATANYS
ncbi:MAG: hypothetical protein FWG19_01555, partial [Methanomassiliicoccaceae archaeon]|nr:hypothetical protein [Methanomassiliicoccaceae archaeon]